MLSIGEIRVRTEFNPSKDGVVDQINQKTAILINLLEEMRTRREEGCLPYPADKETQRLISEAQARFEDAAMWAVKAATS